MLLEAITVAVAAIPALVTPTGIVTASVVVLMAQKLHQDRKRYPEGYGWLANHKAWYGTGSDGKVYTLELVSPEIERLSDILDRAIAREDVLGEFGFPRDKIPYVAWEGVREFIDAFPKARKHELKVQTK